MGHRRRSSFVTLGAASLALAVLGCGSGGGTNAAGQGPDGADSGGAPVTGMDAGADTAIQEAGGPADDSAADALLDVAQGPDDAQVPSVDASDVSAPGAHDAGDAEAGPACSVVCSTNHVMPRCTGGACTGTCDPGFADCSGDLATDGCETAIATDPGHCGACGVACPVPPHTVPSCAGGICSGACATGFADCNAQAGDGCEIDTRTDPAHCGSCAHSCPTNNVPAVRCTAGVCDGACAAGFADCNHDEATDGCETSTTADVNNCGGCGVVCRGIVGRGCTGGMCLATCDDGIRNQGEADVDCSGTCPLCGVGRTCSSGADCRTGVCNGGRCVPVSCKHGFGLPQPAVTATANAPESIAAADLDGDGKLDLALVDLDSNMVSVLLGRGDGTFGPKTDYATGSEPVSVAIGDVNGDGKPDVAVANWAGDTISVYMNAGGDALAARVDYAPDPGPRWVSLADVNGDKTLDLVVATASYRASVLLNNGDGTFGAVSSYSTSGSSSSESAVAVGDMNGDGVPDLVVAGLDVGSVSVLQGVGDGTFLPEADYYGAYQPTAIALADLNGDGKLDVAVNDYGLSDLNLNHTDRITFWLNNGDGTLGATTDLDVGWHARGIVASDLDGDGRVDLAVAEVDSDAVGVLLNTGGGSFGPRVDVMAGIGPYGLALGDFNGDHIPDLATSNEWTTDESVLLNRGHAVFDTRTDYATGPSVESVAFGDLDGDGLIDLVTANSTEFTNSANTVSVLLATGGTAYGAPRTLATGKDPVTVVVADLNGDGALDIATADKSDGTVSVLINQGGASFASRVTYAVGTVPSSLVASDLDGDGKVDLAVNDNVGIKVLFNAGGGTFGGAVSVDTGAYATQWEPQGLAVGDLNGDGWPDFVRLQINAVWGGNVPAVATVLNQGRRQFTVGPWYSASTWTNAVATGDLNGDGTDDVVVGNQAVQTSASVTVFINDGAGNLSGADYAVPVQPTSVAIAEVTGDTSPDVVAGAGVISVLPGTGHGAFGARLDFASTGGGAIAVVDLDGDGRAEVASGGGQVLSVLPNRCLP